MEKSNEQIVEVQDDLNKISEIYKKWQDKAFKLDCIKKKLQDIVDKNSKLYNLSKQKEVNFSEWNLALDLLYIIEEKGEQS